MYSIESFTGNGDLAKSLQEAAIFVAELEDKHPELKVRHVIAYLDPEVADFWWVDVVHDAPQQQ